MKILPPVSIEARRLLPTRWDMLAAVLVIDCFVGWTANRSLGVEMAARVQRTTRIEAKDKARRSTRLRSRLAPRSPLPGTPCGRGPGERARASC